MPRTPFIQPDQAYIFADYFWLNFAPQDILSYFRVTLQKQFLSLPQYPGELDRLSDLQQRIEESLPRLSLTSEMARREFLMALEQWLETEQPLLLGAVSTGTIWQFGQFDRTKF
ncbi:hypothetical protein IQ241_23140 [Romeria aff. gracilis LEGE 07310]|uniref:Uncharacterized protein n=1 Tax=Vasconcelosia minhoensis LEGE 07310 TaxID=915328 RepID=A0A8J7DDR4_9CYAN|nr:hypothetical protein [Romeria gracilis]MBE9080152.1 hypothetical protein [Romeria aff. gracilis LEGE 07310]